MLAWPRSRVECERDNDFFLDVVCSNVTLSNRCATQPEELVAKWWRALLTSATDVARRRAIGATMTTQNADLNSMGWRG